MSEELFEQALQKITEEHIQEESPHSILAKHGEQGLEEYICNHIYKLMQEGKTTYQIADRLKISFDKAKEYQKVIDTQVKRQMMALDPSRVLADMFASNNRMKGIAMDIAEDKANKARTRIESVNAVTKINSANVEMLEKVGFLEAKPLVNKDEKDPVIREAATLADEFMSIMRGEDETSNEDDPEDTDVRFF